MRESLKIITAAAIVVAGSTAAPSALAAINFGNPLLGESLLDIICKVAGRLFDVLMVFGVIAFLVAAFYYLAGGGIVTMDLGGGKAQQISRAKKAFSAAVIGVVLAILAYGLPSIIAGLFNVTTSLPASCQ